VKIVTAGKGVNEPCDPYDYESKETADYASMSPDDSKKQIEEANNGVAAHTAREITSNGRVKKMSEFLDSAKKMCAMNQGLLG